jgi:A/G-specific adenine glycosylase
MAARDALLSWYDRNRRELPWRRSAEPYRVWVSEVMLQQTRVETVLPYFERFLERFPDAGALAAAPLDQVLALWSGLGYYRRARQLHEAARRVAREGVPETAAAWRALPGIGDYTAAAIASIAFGEAVPVLDGNVERLTARLLALAEDPKRAASRRRLRAAAAALLDPNRPGDSNQALMELGARICTPRRPRCPLCPLAADCAARRLGEPERFPRLRERRSPRRLPRVVAVVERRGRRLLFRRGEDEPLLAGLWELPWTGEGAEAGDGDAAAALGRRYGGRWRLGERLGSVRHGITDRSFELEVLRAEVEAGDEVAEGREAGWFSAGEIAALPISSMVRKVLGALAAPPAPGAV